MAAAGSKPPQPEEENKTEAAMLNKKVMRRLVRAVEVDPEANLQDLIPRTYASRLSSGMSRKEIPPKQCIPEKPQHVLNRYPSHSQPTIIEYQLSEAAKAMLKLEPSPTYPDSTELTTSLCRVIDECDVIFESTTGRRFVLRHGSNLVITIVSFTMDYTEYTTLQYLECHMPSFPAPRPHGVLKNGYLSFIIMSYIPGDTFAHVWPSLSDHAKIDIQNQLNELYLGLRQMPFPEGMQVGGVAGEGFKVSRRFTRVSSEAIHTSAGFWDFQYRNLNCSGLAFKTLLHQLTKPLANGFEDPDFTHGDARKANIMVQHSPSGVKVTGIIDWETSGFYPGDFECKKIANTLATDSGDD